MNKTLNSIPYDKIPYLDTTKFDDTFQNLSKRSKTFIMCMAGSKGYYHYKNTAYQVLRTFEINVMEEVKTFFIQQEMYEFAAYVDKVFEIKTLYELTKNLNK